MCGIVGYVGGNEAAPILVDALRRLEYRGYDSAGIATLRAGELDRRRAVGKLSNLADALVHEPLAGKIGIGHTRWATHGAVTVANAHPHFSTQVAVVHNGIIENFRELKSELAEAGQVFHTETDSESVAVLCQSNLDAGMAPEDAAFETIGRLRGAFALCMLFSGQENLIFAARKGPPLLIGRGDAESFVASDSIALSGLAGTVSHLEDGDCAVIDRSGAKIFDSSRKPVRRSKSKIVPDPAVAEKGGYKHFMAKEIFEQPKVLGDALGHLVGRNGEIAEFAGVQDFSGVERVKLVACGTAYLACQIASYWFESLARLPTDAEIASEFRYRDVLAGDRCLAFFVSQSGETADTLAALRHAKSAGMRGIGILNNSASTLAREADATIEVRAGVEIGVASTKAFICQLATLAAMAARAARDRGELDAAGSKRIAGLMAGLPGLLNSALSADSEINGIAEELAEASSAIFLGRGPMFPLALEGALKLKEISYIHAEGFPSGELKHGPIALVDKRLPVVVFAPSGHLFGKTMSNVEEVKARGAKVVLVSDAEGVARAADGVWRTLVMPDVDPLLAPILYAVPLQLLAYHTAVAKGTDVDQPRNLAKSVTVE